MKVAVLGAKGMAGHIVADYLRKQGHEVTTLARSGADINCDVEHSAEFKAAISQLIGYDFIVNCLGVLVADSIAKPDRAVFVNSWIPHHLEFQFRWSGTKIIHISTDCVFDGKKGPYHERSTPNEENAYGRSKAMGELANSKDITMRTSIIGPELKENGTGLLHWFTKLSGDTVQGYTDAWWNGITTLQLAKCIDKWMQHPAATGIYHVVNNDVSTNKYELLNTINGVYGLGKTVIPVSAPKPVNKILIDTRKEVQWGIPDYRTQLEELYNYKVEKTV